MGACFLAKANCGGGSSLWVAGASGQISLELRFRFCLWVTAALWFASGTAAAGGDWNSGATSLGWAANNAAGT
eukprot:CAMPEP_0194734270 /NCGR_PEP_ID=MMETSP0296-20130528/68851_1 /TAXON_ID=39354 /ORGANISM="Heterosigma akashiwo, Strain CCMP2393" /LENGTH=72 /DNA_ID=CAMNT_0039642991 /DNA_START=447 /DNA_END=665 /DNA_ORIENTATION=-